MLLLLLLLWSHCILSTIQSLLQNAYLWTPLHGHRASTTPSHPSPILPHASRLCLAPPLRQQHSHRPWPPPAPHLPCCPAPPLHLPRYEVQRDIKTKERARDALAKRYRNSRLTSDEVLWAIYSLSDNNSYLLFNRDPIDKMIALFKRCAVGGGALVGWAHYYRSCGTQLACAVLLQA